jgi:ubiquinone/menaquinone biosynthesis C-methylase UbiE
LGMSSVFDDLVEAYPAWWIDFLGEHNHVGGLETTKWLLERSQLQAGDRMLDAGAFVGAAARYAVEKTGVRAIATDLADDFLKAGRSMAAGEAVDWVVADTRKLPFANGSFASVWCLDSFLAPREMSRVAAETATLCLCCEVPTDGRGGVEAFIEEWSEYGWALVAHRPMSGDAAVAWQRAESEMLYQRPKYEARYGKRGYLGQLDLLGEMIRAYSMHEQGHGLFVFKRGS